MGKEIERKFLVQDESWRSAVENSANLRQAYVAIEDGTTVRVRLAGPEARLTIKGPAEGLARSEFEYPVPATDAEALWQLCGDRVVEKTRHRVRFGGHVWEIDEFAGRNAGLVLAEVELQSVDEHVELPSWLGPEVSGDGRFDNANLSIRPYGQWDSESASL